MCITFSDQTSSEMIVSGIVGEDGKPVRIKMEKPEAIKMLLTKNRACNGGQRKIGKERRRRNNAKGRLQRRDDFDKESFEDESDFEDEDDLLDGIRGGERGIGKENRRNNRKYQRKGDGHNYDEESFEDESDLEDEEDLLGLPEDIRKYILKQEKRRRRRRRRRRRGRNAGFEGKDGTDAGSHSSSSFTSSSCDSGDEPQTVDRQAKAKRRKQRGHQSKSKEKDNAKRKSRRRRKHGSVDDHRSSSEDEWSSHSRSDSQIGRSSVRSKDSEELYLPPIQSGGGAAKQQRRSKRGERHLLEGLDSNEHLPDIGEMGRGRHTRGKRGSTLGGSGESRMTDDEGYFRLPAITESARNKVSVSRHEMESASLRYRGREHHLSGPSPRNADLAQQPESASPQPSGSAYELDAVASKTGGRRRRRSKQLDSGYLNDTRRGRRQIPTNSTRTKRRESTNHVHAC